MIISCKLLACGTAAWLPIKEILWVGCVLLDQNMLKGSIICHRRTSWRSRGVLRSFAEFCRELYGVSMGWSELWGELHQLLLLFFQVAQLSQGQFICSLSATNTISSFPESVNAIVWRKYCFVKQNVRSTYAVRKQNVPHSLIFPWTRELWTGELRIE